MVSFLLRWQRALTVSICGALMAACFQNCSPLKVTEDLSSELGQLQSVETRTQTTYMPVLADRYYLRSLFESVFGPTTATVDSAKIFFNTQVNGSPCSIYENHAARGNDGVLRPVDPMQACSINAPARLVAQVNPRGTVSREALMARACSDLSNNNQTFAYALAQVSSEPLPQATDENIIQAFQLFYRIHPEPTPQLLTALKGVLQEGGLSIDNWKSLIYTICVSPHWQVL